MLAHGLSPPQSDRVTAEVLSNRQLNRALLARQHLLERSPMTALDMIRQLVGMQSQAPIPPFFGLWTRLQRFETSELDALMTNRLAVRMTLMRATVHVVSAEDALAIRPVIQPVPERGFNAQRPWSQALAAEARSEVLEFARPLLGEPGLTGARLRGVLVERWPERSGEAMQHLVRYFLPLVQVPPRGTWGASHQATLVHLEDWLRRPVESELTPEGLVIRYLSAFGPASAADFSTWSGLPVARPVFERLRPQLVTFRNELGVELFDLPDAPRPSKETPVPARFLPEWDNVLLSHADRRRIMSDEAKARVFSNNGIIRPTILVDGMVAGVWRIVRGKERTNLEITPFAPLRATDRAALEDEGSRLFEFATDGAARGAVRFA